MTALDFQKKHRKALEELLATELGQDLMVTLHNLRMKPTCDGAEHQAAYRLGAIAGYEQCEQNILGLSIAPKTLSPNPGQTYGVPDRPKDQPPKA